MRYLFLLFTVSIFCIIRTAEFIYPVAHLQNGTILLIYQKSLSHLELWFQNPETHQVEQGLLSIFTPAGLQILPDESGFSFIDNGIIRIKYFNKRLPRSLEFDEPITGVNLINWIDNMACYFSAQYHGNYAVFQISIDGILDCILGSIGKDCMYPQKIGSALFYIEREKKDSLEGEFMDTFLYRLKKTHYPTISYSKKHNFNYDDDFDERVQQLLAEKKLKTWVKPEEGITICQFEYPAVFLHMLSENEGFVLEHPQFIDNKDKTIQFRYHHLTQKRGEWRDQILFEFQIPSKLLLTDSPMRIYESILPFLPKYYAGNLYYVNSKNEQSLHTYVYDFETQKPQSIMHIKNGQYCCVPLITKDGLHIGGYRIVKKIDHSEYGLCVELLRISNF